MTVGTSDRRFAGLPSSEAVEEAGHFGRNCTPCAEICKCKPKTLKRRGTEEAEEAEEIGIARNAKRFWVYSTFAMNSAVSTFPARFTCTKMRYSPALGKP